jgi:hypothetical protein
MLGYIISNKEEINVENYEIQSFDILHKTDLNIFVIRNNEVLYKNDIINNACHYGHIQVLEWFKNSGYEFKYTEYAFYWASDNGHIKVLEWFKNYGYKFKYTKWAINEASANGHYEVLEWFKNYNFELKYNTLAINEASKNGYIDVLEWFKNSDYKFKYDKNAFNTNFINILKFYSYYINIKKLIKWSSLNIFKKTIKFKTRNKYLKGYQKN